jgi:hypothetical protein
MMAAFQSPSTCQNSMASAPAGLLPVQRDQFGSARKTVQAGGVENERLGVSWLRPVGEEGAQVRDRVAQSGQLPVQHSTDIPRLVDHHVPGVQVAVHDAALLGGRTARMRR